MIALAVDDERYMLSALVNAVSASPDIQEVHEFSQCSEALNWVTDHPVDVAFLDINMRGMGGMALAEHIQRLRPDCRVVFCTGYSEYALDAFKIHASGYLTKPITPESVQREIDFIKGEHARQKLLIVKCFGSFDVLVPRGEPLRFKRSKTKELLAYLVDRNGSGVTAKQICAVLWEDSASDTKSMNYFWQLVDDLRTALAAAGAEAVLVKTGNCYAVDSGLLDCDYYQHLSTGRPPFRGEYMSQFSWAEETAGFLY